MPSGKQHITIHDIAHKLGISASTVSRALKDNPRISVQTRMRVKELAERYSYKPNSMAASLRKGQGNTVGVIVPNINRRFFASVIGGLEESLSHAGYNLMICQSHEQLEKEKEALSTLINARVEVILMSLSMETTSYEHITPLLKKGVRILFFDRVPKGLNVPRVLIDDFSAAHKITSHLIDQGCKNLAHVGGSDQINIYLNRKNGFIQALKDANIKIRKNFILEEEMTIEGGQRAFELLMTLSPKPDAIVCSGDFAAMGILLSAREKNIQVPAELAITGFANEDFTAYVLPPLTTIDQQGEEIGKTIARKFLNNGHDDSGAESIIEAQILYRDSSIKRIN